ncbi:MAG TPA: hypothetical protein VJ111_13375 [Chitinophagaceae bacterium]|nr:hypothetical protein [Chitinophagaceae bacterium]
MLLTNCESIQSQIQHLLKEIRQLVEQARHNVVRNITTELAVTYWTIGKLIVEKEIQDKNDYLKWVCGFAMHSAVQYSLAKTIMEVRLVLLIIKN